jgi:predicted DNA-binding transcriptional regulator AlpA
MTDEHRAEPQLQHLIRLADLPKFAGLRRTAISELIKTGQFPKPIRLSDSGRAVAWVAAEIAEWQRSRIAKRS